MFKDVAPPQKTEHTQSVYEDVSRVCMWGDNTQAQLVQNALVDFCTKPGVIESHEDISFKYLSVTDGHTVALTKNGIMYAWGHGIQVAEAPAIVKRLSNLKFRWVSAGGPTIAAITSDNKILTWEKPQGDEITKPKLFPCNMKLIQVEVSDTHGIALTANGALLSWGSGMNGKLGHSDAEDVPEPKLIEGYNSITFNAIAVGKQHSCAKTKEGWVYTFGYGKHGQLGHGDSNSHFRPKKVDGFDMVNFTSIAAGAQHTVAVSEIGKLYFWGKHKYLPTEVTVENVQFIQVAAGSFHTLALTDQGSLYSWGYGAKGALGHGDIQTRDAPKRIEGYEKVKFSRIYAGGNVSAAIEELQRQKIEVLVEFDNQRKVTTVKFTTLEELIKAIASKFEALSPEDVHLEYWHKKYKEYVMLDHVEDLDSTKLKLVRSKKTKEQELLSQLYYWMALALKLQSVQFGKSGNLDTAALWDYIQRENKDYTVWPEIISSEISKSQK